MGTLRAAGSSGGVLGGLQTAVTHGEIRGQACVPPSPSCRGRRLLPQSSQWRGGASREPGPQRVWEGGGWREGPDVILEGSAGAVPRRRGRPGTVSRSERAAQVP